MTTYPATEKSYLNDSTKDQFSARLLGVTHFHDKPAIILDQTVFYGEAGGQQADTGILYTDQGPVSIVDVQIEDAVYYHILENLPSQLEPGQTVRGEINMARRWDHMRQHTGQHMLSGAFFKLKGLKTISSRLGSQASTIDISLEHPDWDVMDEIETHVNQMIMENRPISIRYPSKDELSEMSLRRSPKVTEDIRVVDIENFDQTPCGGTHCRVTGEVGYVKIIGNERYKGMVRVTFLAGERAVQAAQNTARTLRQLVQDTECQVAELPNLLLGLKDDLYQARNELGVLRKAHLEQIAKSYLDHSEGRVLIPVVRDHLDAASRRLLAKLVLDDQPRTVALASREQGEGKWMVVLTANEKSEVNLQRLFKEKLAPHGARGGGRPHHVEGFLPPDADPLALFETLKESI